MSESSQPATVGVQRRVRQHTPGPWRVDVDPRPGMEWNREIVADGLTVCFLAHSNLRAPERDEANAQLIAAAPDLLHALRDLVDVMIGRMEGETVALHNAMIALRKADGDT